MNKVHYGVALLCLAFASHLHGTLVIHLSQVDGNVVAQASGSLDLRGVHYDTVELEEIDIGDGSNGAVIGPQDGALYMLGSELELPMDFHFYYPLLAPGPFGAGSPAIASLYNSNSSPLFGLIAASSDDPLFTGILLTPDFTHGSEFNQSMTFVDQTLESMGIAVGSYTWEWENGATATLNVIPEPSLLAVFAGLSTWILIALRKRANK